MLSLSPNSGRCASRHRFLGFGAGVCPAGNLGSVSGARFTMLSFLRETVNYATTLVAIVALGANQPRRGSTSQAKRGEIGAGHSRGQALGTLPLTQLASLLYAGASGDELADDHVLLQTY